MLHSYVIHQLATERRRDLIAQADCARAAAPGRARRRRALFAAVLPATWVAPLPAAATATTAVSESSR